METILTVKDLVGNTVYIYAAPQLLDASVEEWCSSCMGCHRLGPILSSIMLMCGVQVLL